MDTNLTVRLDGNIVERAKTYASRRKMSLSKIVENQLDLITREEQSDEMEVSPYVKSISSGKSIPGNRDWRELRAE